MDICETWRTKKKKKTIVTRTTQNTTFCYVLSKIGVTCARNQPVYTLQPTPKTPHLF